MSGSATSYIGLLQRVHKAIPGLIPAKVRSRTFEQIQQTDAVLDITGGDSFADIYGEQACSKQLRLKEELLNLGKPLLLLPQTYGPFANEQLADRARHVLKRAAMVATRDYDGEEHLRKLLDSPGFQAVTCPDIAFTLPPSSEGVEKTDLDDGSGGPVIGLNVSGLLFSRSGGNGFDAEYAHLIPEIVEWSLSLAPGSRLVLIPHVFGKKKPQLPNSTSPADGSDLEACKQVAEMVADQYKNRVHVIRRRYSPTQMKCVIGQCDFFIGARMHSCIAAASQYIPTAVLAYSKKASGVFGTIGCRELVADMRNRPANAILRQVRSLYQQRRDLSNTLEQRIPKAHERVRSFFSVDLASALNQLSSVSACPAESSLNQ
jgi:polysaccharide pyruvyl transferase WcaK-like protein